MASYAEWASRPGVWRGAIRSIQADMTRRRLALDRSDDGKAGDPRGGSDGGGVHRLSDVLLSGGATSAEAASPDRESATGRAGAGTGRSSGDAGHFSSPGPSPASAAARSDRRGAALSRRGEQRRRKAAGAGASISRREADGHRRGPRA